MKKFETIDSIQQHRYSAKNVIIDDLEPVQEKIIKSETTQSLHNISSISTSIESN